MREIAHCPLSREIQPHKNPKQIKISKIKPSLAGAEGKSFSIFGPGGICFRGAQFLVTEQNWVGLLSTVSPPGGAT